MASPHTVLCAELLERLGSRPDVRVWHQKRVAGNLVRDGERIGRLQSGVRGMADLSGIVTVRGLGLRLEVEAKTGRGELSTAQEVWRAICLSRGVIHLVARSADQCERDLEAAIAVVQVRILERAA